MVYLWPIIHRWIRRLRTPGAESGDDAGFNLDPHRKKGDSAAEAFWRIDSPGLWAILAIAAIGLFNMMGPSHTGGFAIVAALGMVFYHFADLLLCVCRRFTGRSFRTT